MPMHRSLLVLSAVLFSCLSAIPSVAGTQDTDTLSLGPGLLTFEDIAAKLSTPKQPVRCRPAIAHRAAFVCLKNRPRTEVQEILARGLDIAFLSGTDPRDKAALVMDTAPELERREQRWRRILAENLLPVARARWMAAEQASHLTEEAWTAQAEDIQKQLAPLESRRDPADSDTIRILRKKRDALNAARSMTPLLREAHSFLEAHFRQDWLTGALETGAAYRFSPLFGVSPSTVAPLIDAYQKQIPFPIPENAPLSFPGIISGWTLPASPSGIGFSLFVAIPAKNAIVPPHILFPRIGSESVAVPGNAPGEGESPNVLPVSRPRTLAESVFAGMPDTTYTVPGLGKEGLDWFRSTRAETGRFLNGSRGSLPLTAKGAALKGVSAYSQAVAVWCARQSGEAVMELWPGLELVNPQGQPLSEILSEGKDWTLARLFRETDWQMQEQKGALLVKPSLAFVFRPRRFPVAPVVRLLTAMREREVRAKRGTVRPEDKTNPTAKSFLPNLPTFSEIRAYADAAQRYQPWGMGSIPYSYYGLNLPSLDNAEPGFFLYRHLTPDQKAKLETAGSLALSELNAVQRAALLTMLRERFSGQRFLFLLPGVEELLNDLRLYANLSLRMPRESWALDFDTDVTWR